MKSPEEILSIVAGLKEHYRATFGDEVSDEDIKSFLADRVKTEKDAMIRSCLQLNAQDARIALEVVSKKHEPKPKEEPKQVPKPKAKVKGKAKSKRK